MKINIISVGKMQKQYATLFDDYKKKTEFYTAVNVIEIKEVNHKNMEVQREKETEAILKAIPKNSKVILCSLKGKQVSSEDFAKSLNEDNITFVIGGSHGVIEEKFDQKLNISKMTFPHQLFKVILMEQIFRGFAINNNSKYHK